MPKFVNKHRQKRKYTKKADLIESYSFSKTATGILPILVMTIAFMTTMVISTPFRTSFSHIQFTFQMPDFTFANPLNFLQTLAFDFTQIVSVVGSALLTIIVAINETVNTTGEVFFKLVTTLDPRPLIALIFMSFILLGNSLWALFAILGQGIALIAGVIVHIVSLILSLFVGALGGTAAGIANIFIDIGTAIGTFVHTIFVALANVFIVLGNGISFAAVEVFKVIAGAYISTVHFVVFIVVAVWKWFASVINAIVTTFVNAVIVTVHVIEIPFKVLYAFGLMLKPYFDILGRHLSMTGADLDNGFASWGKVAHLLGATK